MNRRNAFAAAAAVAVAALLGGCYAGGMGGGSGSDGRPAFLSSVKRSSYDGVADDLLTGGLGKSGLAASTPPSIASATAPTAAELRRLAIYNNYRALVDVAPRGGYGVLYGPNIDRNGGDTLGEGRIAGVEYVAYADDGTGTRNVTMVVQIPASWDRVRPCVVTASSSGSRGVYGAIGTAGEWGLKRGCIVAYTDKGTGSGVHDLATDTVNLQQGVRAEAAAAGRDSNFTSLSGAVRAAFVSANPFRVAVKHAHSQRNPEKDWGRDTLDAIRFALWAMSEESGRRYDAGNTLVIASSVSNGGGAALAAAEQDTEGLIDGIAVGEPSVSVAADASLRIVRGSRVSEGAGRPLYDYFSYANLLQPCASLSARAAGSPGLALVPTATATNRCAALRRSGVLAAQTTSAQAEEAMDALLAYGWEPTTAKLHASHYALAVPPVTMAYANAYGRLSVAENLCGYSYAGVDATGKPAALPPAALAQVFGTGNGVPPSAGVVIVNNDSVGGALRDPVSISRSSGVADFNADGAACLRALWTGSDAHAQRVKSGVAEIARTANLRGKPAIIVHGRDDTLVPPAFTSRPYYAQNRIAEGPRSKLAYVEVTNAQHFDAFIDLGLLPGYDAMFVPLHHYFLQAMDLVYAHLTANAPLPPSQVVRTTPRGGPPGSAPQIAASNVPPIAQNPAQGDRITFSGTTLTIPD